MGELISYLIDSFQSDFFIINLKSPLFIKNEKKYRKIIKNAFHLVLLTLLDISYLT